MHPVNKNMNSSCDIYYYYISHSSTVGPDCQVEDAFRLRGFNERLYFLSGESRNNVTWNNKTSFSPRTIKALEDLRLNGSLCDCIITSSDGDQFLAHQAILSASSSVVKQMLLKSESVIDRNSALSNTKIAKVSFDNIDGNTLRVIIDYSYTSKLMDFIDTRIACSVLVSSSRLKIKSLVTEVARFLEKNISISNSVEIYKMINSCDIRSTLKNTVQWYITQRLEQIFYHQKSHLLALTENDLFQFLGDSWLNVSSETVVFEIIIYWIDSHLSKLKGLPSKSKLWQTLRFTLLPVDYFFDNVRTHSFFPEGVAKAGSSFFYSFIPSLLSKKVSLLNHHKHSFRHQTFFEDIIAKPRFPAKFLFVFGGWSGGACTSSIEVYDFGVGKWHHVGNIDNGPRAYQRTVLLNSRIYMLGGFDGQDHYSGCRYFDPFTGDWHEIAPMNSRRCYVSACALYGKIYAFGGCDKMDRLKTTEMYDSGKNQWSVLSTRMAYKRSDAGCAKVRLSSGQLAIVVCGGFDGLNCLNSVEMLIIGKNSDEKEWKWTSLPIMGTRRSGLSCCSVNGHLYALGGFDGISRLNSVERYSFSRQEWQPVAPMLRQRSNFATAVINGKILACGGFEGQSTIADCEYFDPAANSWTQISSMNIDRSALSCCLLDLNNGEAENGGNEDNTLLLRGNKDYLSKYVYPREQLSLLVEHSLEDL